MLTQKLDYKSEVQQFLEGVVLLQQFHFFMQLKSLACRIVVFCFCGLLISCSKQDDLLPIYYYNQQQYYYPKPQSQYYYPIQNSYKPDYYPGSIYYKNPYQVPKQGYYYDSDYYYYPPTYYNQWSQDNYINKAKEKSADVYSGKQ